MKTILTLFVAGLASASMLSPGSAIAAPAQIMTDVAGAVRIEQRVPCGDAVNVTTDVAEAKLVITPHVTRDGVWFDLTRLDMFLRPFSVERACRGFGGVAEFSEIGVRLAGAVRFRGQAVRSKGPQVYRFSIPRKDFLIFESVVDNLREGEPETAYQRPSENVTGSIEVRATGDGIVIERVQLHVELATQLHFQAGCVRGRCVIDEVHAGTQTADLVARLGQADDASTEGTVSTKR